jgi:hypothetical protein
MTQLSLADAEAAKRTGLDAVEMNDADFVRVMRTYAEGVSLMNGEVSTDDLRQAATQHGIEPHSPNTWGAILRGKDWEVIGRKKSAVVSNHAREIRVYRYKGGSQ